jgi:preprotein translocase subunit YajC
VGGLAVATTAAGSNKSSSGGFSIILLLVAVMVVFYLTTMRRRRAAAQQSNQAPLEPGSRAVTIGGLHGTVVAVDGSDVLLEVAPDVVLRFERRALARIEPPEGDHELGAPTDQVDGHDDSATPSDDQPATDRVSGDKPTAAGDEDSDGSGGGSSSAPETPKTFGTG